MPYKNKEYMKEYKKEYDRKWYIKHKEEKKEKSRVYRLYHKEETKECSRKYYIDHKSEILESAKAWKADNRERVNESNKNLLYENPWRSHYTHAKQRCTNPNDKRYCRYGGRGIKFLLTMNWVEYLYRRDNARNMDMPSIDRIDNDGNYTLDNCRFIEMAENSRLGITERYTREMATV